jgi:hypothetical protein
MLRRSLFALGMGVSMLAAGLGEQDMTAVPAPSGTVTGHVIFADTRQPARLVEVTLARRPTAGEIKADASEQRSDKIPPRTVAISGRTGLDGSFLISGVSAGDYYVVAKLEGYVLPIGPITSEKQAMDVDTVMRDIPLVSVAGNETAEVNVSLHRGGVISGRVQFEDGTPVVEAFINVEPVDAEERYL